MESKKWWASKTIIGAFISVIGKVVGGYLGYDVDSETITLSTEAVGSLIAYGTSFFGDVMAIYGRVKATKKIGNE